MEVALNIPEILQMIINRLDGPSTAKSARLVSSQWNNAVLSATKPLLTLKLNKFQGSFDNKQIALFSPKLCRRIVISLCTFEEYRDTFDPKKFNDICSLYGDIVENVRFELLRFSGYPGFHIQAIETLNNFPNIQVLWMKLSGMEMDYCYKLKSILTPKPKLVDLTFLEYSDGRMWFNKDDLNTKTMEELSSLLQKMVGAAPNLKRLVSSANLYPNLAGCGKLHSLTWKGSPLDWKETRVNSEELVENQWFDLEKLTILLNQVAQTLRVLKLDCSSIYPYHECPPLDRLLKHGQIPNLVIPPMPNLTVFKTESLVLSPFPGFSHFPLLQVLGLSQKREMWSRFLSSDEALALEERLLACLPTQQNGYTVKIAKFKTDAIHDPANYGRLNQIFPNLQEFSFWLRQDEGLRFGNSLTAVREMLSGMKKIQVVKASLPSPLPDLGELIRLKDNGLSGAVRLKVKMLHAKEDDDSQEMFDRCNLWIPLNSS